MYRWSKVSIWGWNARRILFTRVESMHAVTADASITGLYNTVVPSVFFYAAYLYLLLLPDWIAILLSFMFTSSTRPYDMYL